jgi:hypothetical protein
MDVVHDGDGYLLRSGCNFAPDVERVLASGDQARYLLLDDGRHGHICDGVRGRVAIRRCDSVRCGRAGATVLIPGRGKRKRISGLAPELQASVHPCGRRKW